MPGTTTPPRKRELKFVCEDCGHTQSETEFCKACNGTNLLTFIEESWEQKKTPSRPKSSMR